MVAAYSSSSTSLTVKWSHLPDEHFQGEPIGYKVVYYPVNAESVGRETMNINFTTNTTTLKNLTVYTLYVIHLSAVSSGGIGPENVAKARTDAEGRVVPNIA